MFIVWFVCVLDYICSFSSILLDSTLNNNNISTIPISSFNHMPKLRTLWVQSCFLTVVLAKKYDNWQKWCLQGQFSGVFCFCFHSRLHSNSLRCDCHLSWLSQWLRQRPTLGLYTQCSAPPNLHGLNLAELQKKDFTCSGKSGLLGYGM